MTTGDRFDLHVHSTASDGLLPPREVVALAAQRGLAGIALTDHDTVGGISEAQAMAASLGIVCLTGVELSCRSPRDREVHVLAYLFDPDHAELAMVLQRMRAERLERARAICERLVEHAPALTLDDVLAEVGGKAVGRPHVARAMIRHGLVASVDEAFGPTWLAPGGRAWVPRQGLSLRDAFDLVHRAGGIAVLAHPGSRRRAGVNEDDVAAAAQLGLDGIEVDHPDHDEDAVRTCARLAAQLDLVPTSGSDDHAVGPHGSRLGCRTVPEQVVDRMRHRAQHWRQSLSL